MRSRENTRYIIKQIYLFSRYLNFEKISKTQQLLSRKKISKREKKNS